MSDLFYDMIRKAEPGGQAVMNSTMFYLSIAIFAGTYAAIMAERFPRVFAALIGGGLMIFCGFVTQDEAIREFIDFNTIGLLAGMMILVSIVRMSGFFEAMAVWSVRVTKGRPAELMLLLAAVTAVGSSLIDSVTAVMLLAPVTISLCRRIEEQPYPFLITEVLMSNIGGTALMVGNPPNVMIGSATHLDFNDFFFHLAPAVLFTMAAVLAVLFWIYRKELSKQPARPDAVTDLDMQIAIKDSLLMKRSLFILGLTVIGFIFHGVFNLQSATVALTGATAAMLVCRINPQEAFRSVDWETLFFFMGLFILVGGLEVSGVIRVLAEKGIELAGGNPEGLTFFILWISAIASAVVDNIPFTATMIPLIQEIQAMTGIQNDAMWWALALGACYGGNGTLIGASPNLIMAAAAAREGIGISFWAFTKRCFPLMILSVLVSHIYIYIRYFLF